MPEQPRVTVLSTGGTIAAHRRPGGAVPVLDGDQLLATAMDADRSTGGLVDARIAARTVCAVDSSAMTDVEHRLLVAAVRAELADPDVTGVVITHGTDTLEDSAMLVDLTHHDPRPVVFTGAQYPADAPESDGPANLASALRCALDPGARGRGVLVALGGQVLPARGTFKATTTAVAAFESVHTGLARPLLAAVDDQPSARVDIVAVHPGLHPGIVSALIDSGARGLVLAALGSGNAHPSLVAAVRSAVAAGVPVVVGTRVPYGEVVPTYGGGGGAVDLVDAGATISAWLRPPQARIALSALLTRGATSSAVSGFFAASGPGQSTG